MPTIWGDDEMLRPETGMPQRYDLKVAIVAGQALLRICTDAGPPPLWVDVANGLRLATLGRDGKLASAQLPPVGGEVNTASNVGSAGVGIFRQKTGADLELKKLNGASRLSVTDNVAQSCIDLDAVIGAAPGTLCAGDDDRLSDARAPTAHTHPQSDVTGLVTDLAARVQVGGQLGGSAALPDVRGLRETVGPTLLTIGSVADGEYLRRSGATLVGAVPGAGSAAWTTVKKIADESIISDASLNDDAVLRFSMAALTKYALRLRVSFDTGASGDFKWRHAGPVAPVLVRLRRAWILPGGTAFAGVAIDQAYSAADLAIAGSGTNGGYIEMDGLVHNGAIAGDFLFRWAQNTANVTPTVVRAGSYLEWMAL